MTPAQRPYHDCLRLLKKRYPRYDTEARHQAQRMMARWTALVGTPTAKDTRWPEIKKRIFLSLAGCILGFVIFSAAWVLTKGICWVLIAVASPSPAPETAALPSSITFEAPGPPPPLAEPTPWETALPLDRPEPMPELIVIELEPPVRRIVRILP